MSTLYDMRVEISEYDEGREKALKAAAEKQWPFENWSEEAEELEAFAQGSLSGGEGEEEFADRLVRAIWQANGGYCPITVTATCLEDLPCEEFEFDEEAYSRLMGRRAGD
ncbi:MAG: hypothetical protein ACLP9L_10415 [Thermoguttaceae bacterium]